MISSLNDEIHFSIITRNTDWFDQHPYDETPDRWIKRFESEVFYSSGRHLLNVIRSLSKKVDAVYVNGFYSPSFNAIPLMYALIFRKNVKIIVAPRGMLNPNAIAIKSGQKQALILLFGMLGLQSRVLFHATSTKEKDAIRNVYPKANIKVVSNVVVTANGDALPNKRKGDFLSVGRISPVKNTFELVTLFSDLSQTQLKLIGTADEENYFGRCSQVVKTSSNIIMVGGRNAEEIKQDYQEAGFFISMTSGENFGHAIIEALSFGCPVIISDQTPWNDIEQFGAGWVIPLADKKRWNEAINEALAMNDEAYQQMSARAIAYVKTRFNFEEIRSNYLELFGAKS